jgi:hypothetical protein
MRREHEDIYRKTIDSFAREVRREQFTPDRVPHLVDQFRQELAQCIELGLISSEFYSERMEALGRIVELV